MYHSDPPSTSPAGQAWISRRDFLDGRLIASNAPAMSQSCLSLAFAGDPSGVFKAGRWLRDKRLGFEADEVIIAPGEDADAGRFDICEDSANFDAIIIGGGLAGLSAAFHVLRKRPGTRILLLEAGSHVGGNAARDRETSLPVAASMAGALCAVPYTGALRQFYRELGIKWRRHIVKSPYDCYFLDENSPGVAPEARGWRADMFQPGKRLNRAPYSRKIIEDLARTAKAWKRWGELAGAPDDPPDSSNPRFDYLSQISLADYLTKILNCDPVVVDIYTGYTIDCLGGTAESVNAHSAISFLMSEETDEYFALPGGTGEIATALVNWLANSSSKAGDADIVDIRLNAVALKIDCDPAAPASGVSVTYFEDGTFRRAGAKAMIVATQSSSALHLIDHLCDDGRKAAWKEFGTVPALVANVAVRSMAPFVGLGLAYANHFWGSRHWANFVIADWTAGNRRDPDRASVLTFYGGITVPPEEIPAERTRMLATPFGDYEASLRDDLSRVMAGSGFDFDRDVSAISIYRWGQGMILPTVGSVFGDVRGANGRLDRSKAPRRIARRPLGPISFAGQHTEGTPSLESAVGSGRRAADEVLDLL